MTFDSGMMNASFDENKRITDEYKIGVENFIKFVVVHTKNSNSRIRCTCTEGENYHIKNINDVTLHLYRHSTMPGI